MNIDIYRNTDNNAMVLKIEDGNSERYRCAVMLPDGVDTPAVMYRAVKHLATSLVNWTEMKMGEK